MISNSHSEDRLLSTTEASQRLGVSVFSVRRLIKSSGGLRAVRVGKRVLVPQSEIERVIREGCTSK